MTAPDALPVRAVGSRAKLDAAGVAALFGRGYALRGTERVRLARLGRDGGLVAVAVGPPGVTVDALTADALGGTDGLRLVGPAGSAPAGPVRSVAPCLRLPTGLRRAWGVGETATIALGTFAVVALVADAPEVAVEVDRALWLAAGRPAAARWLPGVAWTADAQADPKDDGVTTVARRVVTETDVRQARLRGQRLRLAPGQVVTPAAQSLAREWNVFEPSGATAPAATGSRR